MKKILLYFLGAWALAVFLRYMAIVILLGSGLFGKSPLWVAVVLVSVPFLPLPLLGWFAGRRWGSAASWKRATAQTVILMALELLIFLFAYKVFPLLTQHNEILEIMPYFPYVLTVLAFNWGEAGVVLMIFLEPILYCVGWLMGKKSKIVDIGS